MKAPAFWYEKPGLWAWLLWPFSLVYGWITSWRMKNSRLKITGEDLKIPVICVGNFTAGGAGKTPTVACIADLLTGSGEKPFILSRGYGGRLSGPLHINASLHNSADCGDEPLLLARHAPTIISRDRLAGARLAEALGATVIIMDDGLQSTGIGKDLVIAVVDGGVGVGNGFCIPAGPLRAPLRDQWSHIDMVLWIGTDEAEATRFSSAYGSDKPMLRGSLVPSAQAIAALADTSLLAFAGIGRPQKFYETLKDAGLDLRATRDFADHHAYVAKDIKALRDAAMRGGMKLVTTEKDAVRLGDSMQDIAVVPVRLVTGEGQLLSCIHAVMNRKRSQTLSHAVA